LEPLFGRIAGAGGDNQGDDEGGGAVTSRGPCGSDPADTDQLASVRATAADQCDCAGATDHGRYVSCVAHVADAAVRSGSLRKACRDSVMRCAAESVCGKRDSVTCCRTDARGEAKCSIKHSAAECKAPHGGMACVGQVPSCCDACGAGGTCPSPTSTTTSLPPLTTTTVTTSTTMASSTTSSSTTTSTAAATTTTTSASTTTTAPPPPTTTTTTAPPPPTTTTTAPPPPTTTTTAPPPPTTTTTAPPPPPTATTPAPRRPSAPSARPRRRPPTRPRRPRHGSQPRAQRRPPPAAVLRAPAS